MPDASFRLDRRTFLIASSATAGVMLVACPGIVPPVPEPDEEPVYFGFPTALPTGPHDAQGGMPHADGNVFRGHEEDDLLWRQGAGVPVLRITRGTELSSTTVEFDLDPHGPLEFVARDVVEGRHDRLLRNYFGESVLLDIRGELELLA